MLYNKEGWTLERAPYDLHTFYRSIYIDAALSPLTNGSKQQLLLVEIKCFPESSPATRELYNAVGQYLIYRAMLHELLLNNYEIVLSVPATIYDDVFDPAVMRVINESKINLIIVDLAAEVIRQWIKY